VEVNRVFKAMGTRKMMPSRKRIYEYWKDKLEFDITDNTCFKCLATDDKYTIVERAHIKSHLNGGDESVENLHLLCGECHRNSEFYEDDVYWWWFNDDSNGYSFKLKHAARLYCGLITDPSFNEMLDDIKLKVSEDSRYHDLLVRWSTL
jgi:hypothetical protein